MNASIELLIARILIAIIFVGIIGAGVWSINAEQPDMAEPLHPTGYYQMAQGEVFTANCPGNLDDVQPAVNVWFDGVDWWIVLACPEIVEAKLTP